MKKDKTCCFTGHRQIPKSELGNIKDKLKQTILTLYGKGVVYFGSGGALGFDTLAAQCVLELKQTYPQFKLIMVLPCKEQAYRWSNEDKSIYAMILRLADKVTYTSEHYTRYCMHVRNRHLVENSNYCICYLTQNTGGTAYTVSFAIKNNLKIINLGDGDLKNE
ncbi:MAG: SLOG family protein [Eubacteriales bacterium]|nr:SLOG family protein [Eubacteriales bacterium]